jgi:hypothetical protein
MPIAPGESSLFAAKSLLIRSCRDSPITALLPFDPSTTAANQHRHSPALAAKHSSRSSAAAQLPNTTHQGLLAHHAEGFFLALHLLFEASSLNILSTAASHQLHRRADT